MYKKMVSGQPASPLKGAAHIQDNTGKKKSGSSSERSSSLGRFVKYGMVFSALSVAAYSLYRAVKR